MVAVELRLISSLLHNGTVVSLVTVLVMCSYLLVSLILCLALLFFFFFLLCFFFQAEDGIRYLVRSRGLGDVYKRQP